MSDDAFHVSHLGIRLGGRYTADQTDTITTVLQTARCRITARGATNALVSPQHPPPAPYFSSRCRHDAATKLPYPPPPPRPFGVDPLSMGCETAMSDTGALTWYIPQAFEAPVEG